MGEYWYPVNLTRREWIDPDHLGNGAKWDQWTHELSATRQTIERLWPKEDEVVAIGDEARNHVRVLLARVAVGPMQYADAPPGDFPNCEDDLFEGDGWKCITGDPHG